MRYLAFFIIGMPIGATAATGIMRLCSGDKTGWFYVACGVSGIIAIGMAAWGLV